MNNNLERILYGANYTNTYSLWGNSKYYDIKNLSPQNYSAKTNDVKVDPVLTPKETPDPDPPDPQIPKTISRDTLIGDNGQKDVSHMENAGNASTYDWTKFYWQKATKKLHTTSESSSDSREDSEAESESEAARGPQRRKTCQAQYKQLPGLPGEPVQISKAANMMAKMGWQGGALGKSGAGITEPIAPNVAYANNKLGLGRTQDQFRAEQTQARAQNSNRGQIQPPAQTNRQNQILTQGKVQPQTPVQPQGKAQKNQAKKNQKKTKTKNQEEKPKPEYDPQEWLMKKYLLRFEMNTLHLILDFVKNNSEIELLFDMKLKREERKHIHQLVNNVISNIHGKKPWFQIEPSHMVVVQMIRDNNCYQLRTKSSGKEPYRQLCLYKTFAVELYVITPEDLNQDDQDLSDSPQSSDTPKSADSQRKSDPTKSAVSPKIADSAKGADSAKSADSVKSSDPPKSADSAKSSDLPQNSAPTPEEEVIETNPFMLSITRNLKKEKEGIEKNEDPKANEKTKDVKPEISEISTPILDVLKPEISTLKVEDLKPEISTSKVTKKLSKTMTSIVELFEEFSEFGFYDEFKFLGPFTEGEWEEINTFFEQARKFLKKEKISSPLKKCFERVSFAVKEDRTGNTTIVKMKVSDGA